MKGKFEITGRSAGPRQSSTTAMDQAMDHFIEGREPMTTMTFQLSERQKRALKRAAVERGTMVKALLSQAIDKLIAEMNQ
jgi:hypothetical protein